MRSAQAPQAIIMVRPHKFQSNTETAADTRGRAVYYTNVLMTVATEFALVCLDMIADPTRRDAVQTVLPTPGAT